jgi:hypothetical protein
MFPLIVDRGWRKLIRPGRGCIYTSTKGKNPLVMSSDQAHGSLTITSVGARRGVQLTLLNFKRNRRHVCKYQLRVLACTRDIKIINMHLKCLPSL